jgi:hypothetical protein
MDGEPLFEQNDHQKRVKPWMMIHADDEGGAAMDEADAYQGRRQPSTPMKYVLF